MNTHDDEASQREKRRALDLVDGFPDTTAHDVEALRRAARTPLGRKRATRWLIALGHSVSSEALSKRANTVGEPFRL